SIRCNQHGVGRLEVFLAVANIQYSRYFAAAIDVDARNLRVIVDRKILELLRGGDGGYGGRVLGVHVAAAAVAIAVIGAGRAAPILLRINGRWPTERVPSQR